MNPWYLPSLEQQLPRTDRGIYPFRGILIRGKSYKPLFYPQNSSRKTIYAIKGSIKSVKTIFLYRPGEVVSMHKNAEYSKSNHITDSVI